MKASDWKTISLAALVLSASFLAVSLVMTNVRLPETTVYRGPAYSYGVYNSTLSAYITPPVSAGSLFTLTLVNAPPRSVEISVFPTQEGTISKVGPIAIESNLVGGNFTSQFISPVQVPYAIWVVSYNKANFSIEVQGTWTPLYILNTYIVPACFATFTSALSLYYFSFMTKRQRIEERVLAEVARKKSLSG